MFLQVSLFAWGAGYAVLDPQMCRDMCEDEETTERIDSSELALLIYDITGFYISNHSFLTPLWFAARMLGNLAYSAFEKALDASMDRMSASMNRISDKYSKTLSADDLEEAEGELEDADLAGKANDLCSNLCQISKPMVLALAIGTCGGSFIADSYLDDGSLDNSVLTTYIKPSLICPVS